MLQELRLDSNEIGADGAKALAEALKVRSDIVACKESLPVRTKSRVLRCVDACGLACVQVNRALRTLDVDDNEIGADGAKAFSEALKVRS